ncbi:DUF4440 domain-containing protein [Stenotrophomonas sp. MYb238]|nr:DUF4440 domain-containing protein [Stenotrophomonas sp. MYb238]
MARRPCHAALPGRAGCGHHRRRLPRNLPMRALIAPLLLFPLLAWAQTPTLEQADTDWNRLRLQGDASALAPLLAEDWLLTHSDGRVQRKADYLQELATRQRRNTRIDNQDVQVRRYGDTAIVTGTSVQAAVSDGQPWEGRFRFTRVWVLREGRWQMVASHSSRLGETRP